MASDPHQPVGNAGGDVVDVNTPKPTDEERALFANAPTTAEAHLQEEATTDTVAVNVPPNTGVHGDSETHTVAPSAQTGDLDPSPAHVEGEPDSHEEEVEEVQADLDSKPTTAEEQILEGDTETQTPEHDQQEEGEHRLEAAAGQADGEQVQEDHGTDEQVNQDAETHESGEPEAGAAE